MRGGAVGFTLIEVVLTITILVALSIFAGPCLSDPASARLTAAQLRVASAIRYAQEQAMTKKTIHGVSFDIASNRFTVYENGNPADPDRDPATNADYVVTLGTGNTSGVTIQSAGFAFATRVEFGTDGTPVAGGSIVLSHPSAGTRTVTVSATTGLTAP